MATKYVVRHAGTGPSDPTLYWKGPSANGNLVFTTDVAQAAKYDTDPGNEGGDWWKYHPEVGTIEV